MQKPLLTILVCGGSCSGKSTFANLFQHAVLLSMDHFYFGKSALTPDEKGQYNFDEPKSVDLIGFAEAVKSLRERKPTTIPVYDMVTSERTGTQKIEAPKDAKFLVVEGIFSFHTPVGELGDLDVAQLDTQVLSHILGPLTVRRT